MMEGIKGLGGGGGGRVGVGEEDMGDGMQCSDHPYRNNPGGICAFCLQEKLGKLVSSAFPLPIRGSSSSSPSPSFRSDRNGGAGSSSSLSLSIRPTSTKSINDGGTKDSHYHEYYTRRARIPFLLAKKKKKKVTTIASSDHASDIVFKRSKSTATPRRNRFLDADDGEDFSPRKRGGFWSFLYFSSSSSASSCSSKPSASKSMDKNFRDNPKITTLTAAAATTNVSVGKQKEKCLGSSLGKKTDIVEDDDSPNSQANASASSFERKVSRSRSVGCGSRSFSGDFFERISTGFGDCTLRRVESQREGKPKVSTSAVHRGGAGGEHHHCMKERVKCGGLFGGFMITSSSSSSSSSSYWVSSSAEEMNGKQPGGPLVHGRSKSWGWAFASPMRAFGKPSSKDGKRDIIRDASDKNTTPNLAAIPSLLAVRG
ncbi:hypothetical protein I3842_01G145700 [Carya illinoinensis]|uniref:Uncharacterized protein n=1 Tax=Carya illinoinensis TaxID=32201 RepID=A0A922G0D6_CARIL|nr:hypothetical protein I3842_01G145700 [Carya illinoinensis]KAG6731761.1 hypothetical protein I3842_01G145700 [Carya illinoinensis]